MAAGDQQGDEGKRRRVVFQQRCQQVALHVVYLHCRHAPGPGQAAADGAAHQQGADQSGAGGEGDAVDVVRRAVGVRQHLADQRQGLAHMITRGQLRHHAAVVGVQGDLAVQGVGQQALFGVVNGDAGFIAGGLDAEDSHRGASNFAFHS